MDGIVSFPVSPVLWLRFGLHLNNHGMDYLIIWPFDFISSSTERVTSVPFNEMFQQLLEGLPLNLVHLFIHL